MLARRARVCCLDLDTFFVSVERLLDRSLLGKAVVVGGHKGGRGVVTSSSYEARAFGVRSGMSVREASALAPDAIFLPGHHEFYASYSRAAREIVERFSPIVVAASIDEQYIDFHGCESLYRKPEDADDDATILRVVHTMTRAIGDELGLPASAGLATSRSLAKVACTLAKPRGVRFVPAGEEEAFLAPLPARRLPGIGPVSEEKLARAGIFTLAELARAPDAILRPIFGAYTAGIRRDAIGAGGADLGRERPAFQEHDPRGLSLGSISNERTFVETGPRDTASILCGLCERVCARARARGVRAGSVTLRLRYVDFETITRSRVITPTNVDLEVHRAALALYRRARSRPLAVRLLGVALSKLSLEGPQLDLPTMDGGARRARTIDAVREKYGYDAVHLATTRAKEAPRCQLTPALGHAGPSVIALRIVAAVSADAAAGGLPACWRRPRASESRVEPLGDPRKSRRSARPVHGQWTTQLRSRVWGLAPRSRCRTLPGFLHRDELACARIPTTVRGTSSPSHTPRPNATPMHSASTSSLGNVPGDGLLPSALR